MILTNPGGPGESAIDFLVTSAEIAREVIGANYDLVAWEPRGLGHSVPLANCSISKPLIETSRLMGRKLRNNHFSDGFFSNLFEQAEQLGEACRDTIGGVYQDCKTAIHMTAI
jgi:pimeloyl-ACP methyl ester carboxylesterase